MNKFFKGAIACAMIAPCLTGLTGCTKEEKVDKTEIAYKEVFSEIDVIGSKFNDIEMVGTEFQLNVNMSINVKKIIDNIVSPDGEISTQLKAVLGARSTQTNKEIFGNIGIIDGDNNETSILNAYIADSNGETEYAEVGTITETQWNELKNSLYINSDGVYVSAGTTEYNATTIYYIPTEDLIHVYMHSNISALDDAIGVNVSGLIPSFNDGKVYGTLYVGDDIIEDDDNTGNEGPDLDSMIPEMPDADDYAELKADLSELGMAMSAIDSNGDVGIRISGEGSTIELIAKANGGLRMTMNMIMPSLEEDGSMMNMELTIDMDLVEEIEDKYIPTDLDAYEGGMDLEAWLNELMSGFVGE